MAVANTEERKQLHMSWITQGRLRNMCSYVKHADDYILPGATVAADTAERKQRQKTQDYIRLMT